MEILQHLLNCGSADVPFLESEIDAFEINLNNINWQLVQMEDAPFNEALNQVYFEALKKTELLDAEYEIWTNYLDSRLTVHVPQTGEWMEANDLDDLKTIKKLIDSDGVYEFLFITHNTEEDKSSHITVRITDAEDIQDAYNLAKAEAEANYPHSPIPSLTGGFTVVTEFGITLEQETLLERLELRENLN